MDRHGGGLMLRYLHRSGPASDPFDTSEAARVRVPSPRREVHPSVARDGQAEINRPAKAENRLLLGTSHAAARSCERSARISGTAFWHELHHGRKPFSPRRGQLADRRVRRQRNRVYPIAPGSPGSSRGSTVDLSFRAALAAQRRRSSSISSSVRGQSSCIRRDSARSARSRPPVWQRAQ